MEWSIYSDGTLVVTRDCPDCIKCLKTHPTLHTNITQKQAKDGHWYHTSPHGRTLHKLALREQESK